MKLVVLTQAVETIQNIDLSQYLLNTVAIIGAAVILYELAVKFSGIVKNIKKKPQDLIDKSNRPQNEEIEKIKKRQDDFEEKLNSIQNAEMLILWDRVMHFGMQYIKRGHISYAEADILMKQYEAYHATGGNGHLKRFIERLKQLPYTEELSPEEITALESSANARKKDVALASKDLSMYYESSIDAKFQLDEKMGRSVPQNKKGGDDDVTTN